MDPQPMPFRRSLSAECARVIGERIRSGEWQERLPGERRLAELLQVGRDTIRQALIELERSSVIAGTASGSRRQILRSVGDVAREGVAGRQGQAFRIGMLSTHRLEQLPQSMLFEVDQIRTALAAKGGMLRVFAPAWYDHRRIGSRLAQLVAEEACSAWILHRSSPEVQRWFESARVPCLVRGYPQPGVALPFLDVDWKATAHHAAAYLWRLGHQRVAVIAPEEALGGVAAAVQGIMDFPGEGYRASLITEDGSVDGLIHSLQKSLGSGPAPTAIIATRPRQAATALSWLVGRGVRVPAHVSLITLADELFLDYLVPRITSYRIDPESTARIVVRRLESLATGGRGGGTNPWLDPSFEKGASTAPPLQRV
jgi:DNA-binding LacI/PurR family transcriptional regulator